MASRSIPAHAGEPSSGTSVRIRTKVYPRTRGGTGFMVWMFDQRMGLSPHTRGNPPCAGWYGPGRGSIPAHAGEPPSGTAWRSQNWVYPRTRGGTSLPPVCTLCCRGLSPHTRGNPGAALDARRLPGSIPAHAGEPPAPVSASRMARVYPRTRGGTDFGPIPFAPLMGLSPHTRGNPIGLNFGDPCVGSIPAHAGEPIVKQPAR